jgi:hypothetical protein
MIRPCASLALVCVLGSPASGQEARSPVIKLTARPAAAPSPALKYQLLPELRDMSPGNAALVYQRAHSPEWFGNINKWLNDEKVYDWLDLPLQEFPSKRADFFRTWGPMKEIDRAARTEHCDWQMTERVKAEGISMLLPDVQGFRQFGMFLAIRARQEIVAKQYDKAVYSLQSGFALSQHVNEAPILISNLVGNAIASTTLDRVEELMQAEGAPNLYWALTALPRPFMDLRRAMQGERLMLEATLPELRTIETTTLTKEQQKKLSGMLKDFETYALGGQPRMSLDRQFGILAGAMRAYPHAKRTLIAQGRTAEDVEALPVVQVILIHALQQYRHHQDELQKWIYLPYAQARAGLMQSARAIRTDLEPGGAPFHELLPAVQKVYEASVRLDRRIAALRCLEAVRLHAAAHDGKVPASLKEVTVAPIPADPATGKQFVYQVEGNRVTLREPLMDNNQPALPTPLHYEMMIVR